MLKMKLAMVATGSLCLFAGVSAVAGPNDVDADRKLTTY